jgi:hypothetical protein
MLKTSTEAELSPAEKVLWEALCKLLSKIPCIWKLELDKRKNLAISLDPEMAEGGRNGLGKTEKQIQGIVADFAGIVTSYSYKHGEDPDSKSTHAALGVGDLLTCAFSHEKPAYPSGIYAQPAPTWPSPTR